MKTINDRTANRVLRIMGWLIILMFACMVILGILNHLGLWYAY